MGRLFQVVCLKSRIRHCQNESRTAGPAQPSAGADHLQRPLVPRSRFRRRLTASVGQIGTLETLSLRQTGLESTRPSWPLYDFNLVWLFQLKGRRIKTNLLTFVNNTTASGYFWIFTETDTVYADPLSGWRGYMAPGQTVRIEVDRGKVQIGLRLSEGWSDWIVKPALIETNRDVEFSASSSVEYTSLPWEGASEANVVTMMTDPKVNNAARSIVIAALGKIPTVGGALSGLIGMIWKEVKPDVSLRLGGLGVRGRAGLRGGSGCANRLDQVDPIILDFRNRALADRIVADPHDKIFITYSAHHLTGVFELLQKQDPAWKVTSVKWLRTIEVPKQFERELGLSGSGHP
jgi:hypothetical protein